MRRQLVSNIIADWITFLQTTHKKCWPKIMGAQWRTINCNEQSPLRWTQWVRVNCNKYYMYQWGPVVDWFLNAIKYNISIMLYPPCTRVMHNYQVVVNLSLSLGASLCTHDPVGPRGNRSLKACQLIPEKNDRMNPCKNDHWATLL